MDTHDKEILERLDTLIQINRELVAAVKALDPEARAASRRHTRRWQVLERVHASGIFLADLEDCFPLMRARDFDDIVHELTADGGPLKLDGEFVTWRQPA
jgi:hypothetical protein